MAGSPFVCSRSFVTLGACSIIAASNILRPPAVDAQEGRFAWPTLEVRGGIVSHGAGGCLTKRATGAIAGVDVRSQGRWILSAAVDLFMSNINCFDILYTRQYAGQTVERWGSPELDFTTPRLAVSLGYGFSVYGRGAELMAGLGAVRTRIDYGGPAREEITWRPWYGAGVVLRLSSALGVQLEAGWHQLAERYYAAGRDYYDPDGDVIVAEIRRWEPMWRLGVTVPVIPH